MKFIFSKKILILFTALVLISFFSKTVFAVWNLTFYNPGDTLNPECLPTDVDCDVLIPVGHDAVTIGTAANGLSLATQVLSLGLASASTIGALSDTDWSTFNNKQPALFSGANIKTINGASILSSGDLTLLTSLSGAVLTTDIGTTVLAQRTFGTAANNNTGDFLLTGGTAVNSALLENHNAAYFQVAGTYSTDIHGNISALNAVSGTNTGDNAVNTLYSGLTSSQWTTTGSNIYYNTGNVGIGNSAPTNMLSVGSNTAGGSMDVNGTLGSELAPALEDANWSDNAYWTVGGGVAVKVPGGGNITATGVSAVIGTTYKVSVTINPLTVANISVNFGGFVTSGIRTAGTHVFYIKAITTGGLILQGSSTSNLTVTSLSVKAVTTGTGDIYANGSITSDTVNARRVIADWGSLTEPGIAFRETGGTGNAIGFYMNSADSMAYVRSGVAYVTFGASGLSSALPITLSTATHTYGWTDLFLSRPAAATLQLGAANTTTAGISQTLQTQGAITTADTAGGSLTIRTGAGTGNAVGAPIYFATPDVTTSGSTAQAQTTKMTILGDGKVGIGTTAPLTALDINTGTLRGAAIISPAGTALSATSTAPSATTGASQVGIGLSLTASPAVASTDTAGAAAGGSVTISAGNAARLTSGNANGGDVTINAGAGIGTGVPGSVKLGYSAMGSGVQIIPASSVIVLDPYASGGNIQFKYGGSTIRQQFYSTLTTLNTRTTIGPAVTATGALVDILYTGAIHTNQTLSTEIPGVNLGVVGRQWATGALTTQREVLITQPTYSFVGASTITDATTLGIVGAPIGSTNATITNAHGFLIGAGALTNTTNSYGLTVNAQTGASNNYAAAFLGGNVGIGTTVPIATLSVLGPVASFNDTATTFRIESNAVGTDVLGTYGAGITFAQRYIGNDSVTVRTGAIVGVKTFATGGFGGGLAFLGQPNSAASMFEIMRLTSSGNVGIGTTNPSFSLDVLKSQNATSTINISNLTSGTAAAAELRATSNATGYGSMAKIGTGYTTYKTFNAADLGIYNVSSGNISFLNDYASGKITFTAGGSSTEHLVILATGNVGIGTTAPTTELDLSGQLNISEKLGAEMVVNGGFTTDTDWVKGVTWTWNAGGYMTHTSGVGTLTQTVALVPTVGTTYKIQYTVSNWTVAGMTVTFGGIVAQAATMPIANGVHTLYVTANTTGSIIFTPVTGARYDIDNVTIKPVLSGLASTTGTTLFGNKTLSDALSHEVAYQLNYTTNKATGGNDTGLLINHTDVLSPGTSRIVDFVSNGTSKLSVTTAGQIQLGPYVSVSGGQAPAISATSNDDSTTTFINTRGSGGGTPVYAQHTGANTVPVNGLLLYAGSGNRINGYGIKVGYVGATTGTGAGTAGMSNLVSEWVEINHATRKTRFRATVFDYNAERTFLTGEADSTGALISLGGTVVDTTAGTLISQARDIEQLKILGNATQTSNLITASNSSDVDVFTVSNAGNGYFAGNVGIGTTAPDYKLHVGSDSVTDATVLLRLQDANSTCDFNANTGAPSCGSDETLKKNINSQTDNLIKILSLRPVTYNWLTDQDGMEAKHGFIAQEVAKIMPELVTDGTWIDGSTKKFLQTAGMTPYIVGAIQELNLSLEGISGTITPLAGSTQETFVTAFFNNIKTIISTWLGEATNGLANIFVKEVNTNTLCVSDESGAKTCITKSELDALILNAAGNSPVINTPPPSSGGTPPPQGGDGSPSSSPQGEGVPTSSGGSADPVLVVDPAPAPVVDPVPVIDPSPVVTP